MTKTLLDLNVDTFCMISEYLDVKSCLNFSKTSAVFMEYFRKHIPRKLLLKKLQCYLIDFLLDCRQNVTIGQFQVSSHLCKSILSHFSHMAHNFHILSNANHVKERMIVEFVLKSLSLPTSGLDIFPPVDPDCNLTTWINHWYCYEVPDNSRYIFLINCIDIDGWFKKQTHSDKEFVSGVIHYPCLHEERTMFFACRLDPICDWQVLIEESW